MTVCWMPEEVRAGQGTRIMLEKVVLTIVAILTSPLLALVEVFHSFCEWAPPSVEREKIWGQTHSLVLLLDWQSLSCQTTCSFSCPSSLCLAFE